MLSTLIGQLESKGYRVLEADTERTWFEIEAINIDGQRIELIVDASTGEILREQADE